MEDVVQPSGLALVIVRLPFRISQRIDDPEAREVFFVIRDNAAIVCLRDGGNFVEWCSWAEICLA
jgi:hypothetical protein